MHSFLYCPKHAFCDDIKESSDIVKNGFFWQVNVRFRIEKCKNIILWSEKIKKNLLKCHVVFVYVFYMEHYC